MIFEGYSFAFLVMITMFVSAFFLGMSLIVFFSDCRLWLFDAHLAYQLQVVALCPSDPFVGLLSFAYGVLIDSVYALIYHIPWWTMLWSMVLVLTWPMLCQRSFSIPLSIKSLGDFMLKKSISSLMTFTCSSSFSELRSIS